MNFRNKSIEWGIPLISAMLVLALGLFTSGCGGGGSSDAPATTTATTTDISLSGIIQKGPLIKGSNVTLHEIDKKFNPTGKSYTVQTTDAIGSFSYAGTVESPYMEVVAEGFFYDELTGNLSSASITLRAVIEVQPTATANVNLLSSLAAPRIKALITSGDTFAAALNTAQQDVLNAFQFVSNSSDDFTDLDITGSRDSDGMALAASVLLLQIATQQAAGPSEVVAKLSLLLTDVSSDLATDGIVTNAGFLDNLAPAAFNLDTYSVANNMNTIYSGTGVSVSASTFSTHTDSISQLYPYRKRAASQTQTDLKSACEYNGKIYFPAAVSRDPVTFAAASSPTGAMFDPYTNAWSILDPSNTWVTSLSATRMSGTFSCHTINNKMYIVGGADYDAMIALTGGATDYSIMYNRPVQEYDPITNTWATKTATIPTPKDTFSSSVHNGLVYTFGGHTYAVDGTATSVTAIEVYNPATDSWQVSASSMPTAKSGTFATTIADKIYLLGGYAFAGTNSSTANYGTILEEFSPLAGTWKTLAALPSVAGGAVGSSFDVRSAGTADGKLYASALVTVGGVGSSGNQQVFMLEYNPATDTWSQRTGKLVTNMISLGNKIYSGSGTPLEYTPSKDAF